MCKWIPAGFLCSFLALTSMVGTAKALQQQNDGGISMRGQQPRPRGQQPASPPIASPSPTLDMPMENSDPTVAMQEHRRQMALMNDRQKRIVDDTAKLLRLATELKDDVDKSSKDTMSLDVIKKADEIEKLAHNVKNRMKG